MGLGLGQVLCGMRVVKMTQLSNEEDGYACKWGAGRQGMLEKLKEFCVMQNVETREVWGEGLGVSFFFSFSQEESCLNANLISTLILM